MKHLKLKGIAALVLAAAAALCVFAGCDNNSDDTSSGGTSSTEEAAGGWENKTYTFNGSETTYSVYVPAGYNSSDSTVYPLVCFMPDATLVGSPVNSVKKENGAKVWTTDEEQAKHKCFVVIPQVDTMDDKEEMFYEQICQVISDYNIDTTRVYYTGQSMGGIAGFVINANHPNFFAATYYVACQNDETVYTEWSVGIEDMNVIYTASMGDEQAYPGQQDLMAYLDGVDCDYATVEVNPKGGDEVETAVTNMLESNSSLNHFFVQYTAGILATDTAKEHLNTWVYAYGIEAVRDWIFEQSLEGGTTTDTTTYTGISAAVNTQIANSLLIGQSLTTNNLQAFLTKGSTSVTQILGMGVDDSVADTFCFVVDGQEADSYQITSAEWTVTVRYTGSKYNVTTKDTTISGTATQAEGLVIIPGAYSIGDGTYTPATVDDGSSSVTAWVIYNSGESKSDRIDCTITINAGTDNEGKFVAGENIITATSVCCDAEGNAFTATLTYTISGTEGAYTYSFDFDNISYSVSNN